METPSLEDMDVVDEFGGIKPGMPALEEDRLAAAAKVKAAEAEVYVTKMQLVMDAGDEPETPVEQATTAFYEATKAAEEAAAAALAAHAARAENIAASRKNIMNFLLTAIRLPRDPVDGEIPQNCSRGLVEYLLSFGGGSPGVHICWSLRRARELCVRRW